MNDAFTYSLHPYPPTIYSKEGTHKNVEAIVPSELMLSQPPPTSGGLWIQDGMALLQEFKDVPLTFGKVADAILGKLLSVGHQYGARRIDFVPDRYPA